MAQRQKTIEAWGGFTDGKLYVMPSDLPLANDYDEPRYAVFPTKRAAKRAFEDVRRVKIVVNE